MKRMSNMLLVLMGFMVISLFPVSASASAAPSVFVNGVLQDRNDSFVADGRTLIKLRALTDPTWLVFAYDPKTHIVMFHTKDNSIYVYLHEGDKTATVNDKKVPIDTAVVNKDGFTYVPLRFISETLGAYVHYFAEDNRIIVRSPKAQAQYETLMHGDLTEARKIAMGLTKLSGDAPPTKPGEGYDSYTYTFPEGEALRFIFDSAGYSQGYYEVNEEGLAVLKWQHDAVADQEWGTKPNFEHSVYFEDLFISEWFYYGTEDEQGNMEELGRINYGSDGMKRIVVMPIEGEKRIDAKS